MPRDCFAPLDKPKMGDWLREHKEKKQTFKSFLRRAMKAEPHGKVRVVELVPLGPFGVTADDAVESDRFLEALRQYTAIFFACECKIGKAISLTEAARRARCGDEGQLQLHTGDIFDIMNGRKRNRDVLVSVCITVCDLYISKRGVDWNFVYGQVRCSLYWINYSALLL